MSEGKTLREALAAKLRAMATNYPSGHMWDKLDAKVCIEGALLLDGTHPKLAAQAQADPDHRYDVMETLRKALNKLPRYSFWLGEPASVRKVPDKSGAWIEWQAAHELFDAEVLDHLMAGRPQPQALPQANSLDRLADAFDKALDDQSVEDVLSVLTGAFVGLVVEVARRNGGDGSLSITIDGGDQRDITIHPVKK